MTTGSDDVLSVGEDSYQNTIPDDDADELEEGGGQWGGGVGSGG